MQQSVLGNAIGSTSKNVAPVVLPVFPIAFPLPLHQPAIPAARPWNRPHTYHSQIDSAINVREQSNELLEAESLEVAVLKIGHAGFVGTKR